LSVTITVKGKELTITADNVAEALPVIDRFLDG
jgi:hypothetical protein